MTQATDSNISTGTQSPRTGFVEKRSGDQSVSVVLHTLVKHETYGKYVRRQRKLAVHDPKNLASVGDEVEIIPCRPVSKRKRWRIVRVLNRAADKTVQ